jgi:DNA-directed RNA polymerase specialized sigma subunit
MAKDTLIPIPKKVWAAMVKEYGDKATDHIMHQALLIDVDLIPVFHNEDHYEDMLRELAPTYREKAVLELRMELRTFQEIGEIICLSHVMVYKIIQDLQERYLRACRRNPNLPRPK